MKCMEAVCEQQWVREDMGVLREDMCSVVREEVGSGEDMDSSEA